MRINYVLPASNLVGGIRTFAEITKRLAAKGHHVSITLPARPEKAFTWQVETRFPSFAGPRRLSLRVIDKLFSPGLAARTLNFGLEKAIPDCDINVATFCMTTFPVHKSGKGKPFFHMQHYEPLMFDKPRLKKLAEETYLLPLTKIANSTWLRNTVKEKVGITPHLVLHGMDHDIFNPKEISIEKNRRTVVAYGRQTLWKGVPDLLEAMHIVMTKRNDVDLTLYGASPITHTRAGVPYKFLQGISDEELAKLYSSADVVACPSWYESFPLPPLEAMACGAPVVTTRYGTEDYAVDEENSLVVPPKDPEKMANAILRLLMDESLSERLRKAGPKKAKEFNWDKTADGFERIFRGEA